MLQRIQTLYLLFTLAALIVLTIGTNVFETMILKPDVFVLESDANVYGIQKTVATQGEPTSADLELIRDSIGSDEVPENTGKIPTFYFPFYSLTIILSMLCVVVIMSYKNLKRQLKFGRLLFVLNLFTFIAAVIFYYLIKGDVEKYADAYAVTTILGLGFYCIVIATAFSFLANIGIRRDLRLIQSIDRIR
ncbi:MAG: DUF4293 family protein [Brumimicrobium sp.]|nr:DUF4293 family protein [Brumimicrobium sp.]